MNIIENLITESKHNYYSWGVRATTAVYQGPMVTLLTLNKKPRSSARNLIIDHERIMATKIKKVFCIAY